MNMPFDDIVNQIFSNKSKNTNFEIYEYFNEKSGDREIPIK